MEKSNGRKKVEEKNIKTINFHRLLRNEKL